MKQELIDKVVAKLDEYKIKCELGNTTDVKIDQEFLDAKWITGEKKIEFHSLAYFNEGEKVVYYHETTKDIGSGFSFGTSSETEFQSGMTLFRKIKNVGYGPDGKAFEYELDLGAIAKTFKEVAKEAGWKFKTVIMKNKALYPKNEVKQEENVEQFKVEPEVANENVKTPEVVPVQEPEVKPNTSEVGSQGKKRKSSVLRWILIIIALIILALVIFPGNTTSDNSDNIPSVYIDSATYATKIDSITFAPKEISTDFTADSKINYVVSIKSMPAGAVLYYEWYYENYENYEKPFVSEQYNFDSNVTDKYLNISFTIPDGEKLPIGEYNVKIRVEQNLEVVYTSEATCNVLE